MKVDFTSALRFGPVLVEGFPSGDRVELLDAIETFNDHHADALALIARAHGSSEVETATVRRVSPDRLDLLVRALDRTRTIHVSLDPPLVPAEASARVVALVAEARRDLGDGLPSTRLERELRRTRALPTIIATVCGTRQLSAGLREVTVRGRFDALRTPTADHFMFVQVPHAGQPSSVISDGASMASLRAAPAAERPAGAYYTVRAFRPEVNEIDLWFVLHEPQSGVGGWAASARVGDRLALWGPRGGFELPDATTELLLIGDETALPSIASILDFVRPLDIATHVVVETLEESHTIELPQSPHTFVQWAFRRDAAAHESTALIDRVRDVVGQWRPGLFAYGAGEASRVIALRDELRALGAGSGSMKLTSYWRHGKALNG